MAKTDGTGSKHPLFNYQTTGINAVTKVAAPVQRPVGIVRVRAIGPRQFSVAGNAVALGAEVDVPGYVAADLVACGKAEYA